MKLDPGRDESRNRKIPYRPTPYIVYTDQIPLLQEKTKSGKYTGKSGEFRNGSGLGNFLTEFSVTTF